MLFCCVPNKVLKKSFLVKHSGPTKEIDMETIFFPCLNFKVRYKLPPTIKKKCILSKWDFKQLKTKGTATIKL